MVLSDTPRIRLASSLLTRRIIITTSPVASCCPICGFTRCYTKRRRGFIVPATPVWGNLRALSIHQGVVRIPGFGQPPLHRGARYPEDLAYGPEALALTPQPGHRLHLVVVNP